MPAPGPLTFGTPDYAAPVDPVTGVTVAPTVTTRPGLAAPRRTVASDDGGGSADRATAALLLVLGGAGLWYSARQSNRQPRLLGALVEADD